MRRTLVWFLFGLLGCGPQGTVGLKNVRATSALAEQISPFGQGQPPTVSLAVNTTSDNLDLCPIIGNNGAADVDGDPIGLVVSGSATVVRTPGLSACYAITFFAKQLKGQFIDDAAAGKHLAVTAHMSDDTDSWSMTTAAPFDPRQVGLVAPASGMIHAGDTISLSYQPATDAISVEDVSFVPTDLNPNVLKVSGSQVTVTIDKQIQLVAPAGLSPGSTTIAISLTASPQVLTCVGPTACSANVDLGTFNVPVVVK